MENLRSGEHKEYAPREKFLSVYDNFVDELRTFEMLLNVAKDQVVEETYWSLNQKSTEPSKSELTPEERKLFDMTLSLFCLKNGITPFSIVEGFDEFAKNKDYREFFIETEGPISVGKTTLTGFLAENIGAQMEIEKFLPSDNPFLALSYNDPGLMLRTQLNFLFSNISSGIGSKLSTGRWTRDTSVWSDIYTYMEWRLRNGQVTKEEHSTYMKVVDLLDPIIPRPSLLIKLLPSSVEKLYAGLQKRIEANPTERIMEKAITLKDLEIVTNASKDAVKTLKEKHGINAFVLEIDPVEIYEKAELRYATVYSIREQLGILGELLKKDPKEVGDKILSIFAEPQPPRVIVVHSKSMFTGKTSSLNFAAEKLGRDKIIAFQPRAAIRYGAQHEVNMIDRDRRMIPAQTIETNKLEDILKFIKENKIAPKDKPFVFVDEVMLFTGTEDHKAVEIIKELQNKGFNVVVDGIDYTFQEEPFKFIHGLVGESKKDDTWFQIELGTKCKYCDKDAQGTRRLTLNGETADYNDTAFQAGENYEPVCCEEHKSCTNQPRDFVRQPLPTEV